MKFVDHPFLDGPDVEQRLSALPRPAPKKHNWIGRWDDFDVDLWRQDSVWTREEAEGLFLRYNYARKIGDTSAACALEGEIIEQNYGLICWVVIERLGRTHHLWDEVVADCLEIMLQVVRTFDLRRGFTFATYATQAMHNCVNTFLRNHERLHRDTVAIEFDIIENRPDSAGYSREEVAWAMARADLTPAERDILYARFIQTTPLTLEEAGRTLSPPRSKERTRQLQIRACEKLKEILA